MLTFDEIVVRTEREIESLRTAPIGTEFEEDIEIEDEKERVRLLQQAEACLKNLKATRDHYRIEQAYQKKSILFLDDFMD